MKAFIVRVVFIVVFLVGLGGLAENISLFFQPKERQVIRLAEFQAPDLKVVKLETPRKIVIRRFQTENPDDCRMKIGPVLPNQIEYQFNVVWQEKISQ